MPLRIEDYGLIGDCQTGALVGKDGSIDWLCLPRFDSGACFAALLGTPDNGRWLLSPNGHIRQTRRRYLGDTLILETEYETDSGCAAVIDFMPIRHTTPDLVRIVEGRGGSVEMKSELVIRFDYGSIIPWVQRTSDGLSAIAGPDALLLHSPVHTYGENMKTVATFSVREGERIPFTLTYHQSFQDSPKKVDPLQALEETRAWWNHWSSQCTYDGEYRNLVMRSLITLKAMTYAPSGGIIAALTTSLPEHIGGVRNWDYRHCWIRDATLTLLSLLNAGYREEARAWREWLHRAVAGNPATLQIMYGVCGERRLEELELSWLAGYESSTPVRIGNAASAQFQLDVYGEISDALHHSRKAGLKTAEAGWKLESALIRFVESAWEQPDEGIWEVRGPRQQFTHSKIMAWVALDRAIKSAETFGLEAPIQRWCAAREAIHTRVCKDGFNSRLGSFVQVLGSELLDASLLMIPIVGFLPPDDPRVRGTITTIEKQLSQEGFLRRYDSGRTDDGLPEGEGAFLPCSYWLADNYALIGSWDRAHDLFERLAGVCNDLGLCSEEYDPQTKRLLGNFPQAFTHLALVNTALNLRHPSQGPADQRQES